MSKGLEALQFMRERDTFLPSCASTIEKELKALEIIKDRKMDLSSFHNYTSANHYNLYHEYPITQEEYDLLKEVLKRG